MGLIYRGETNFQLKGANPVKLPLLLTGQEQITCLVQCRQKAKTWTQAGFLEQFAFLPDSGMTTLRRVRVDFDVNQLIELDVKPQSFLRFIPVKWLNFKTSIAIFDFLKLQSLFSYDQVPVLDNQEDGVGYELGQEFQVLKAGYINAIRYYKAGSETGTHMGRIWNTEGVLSSVAFTNETSAGWQQQALTTPLFVNAGSYIVSVNANLSYVATNYNPPLTFSRGDLRGSSSGLFGALGVRPSTTVNNNYFRDIVFR
jgi:hypothetical protein